MLKFDNKDVNNIKFNDQNVYLVKKGNDTVWQASIITVSQTNVSFANLIAGYGNQGVHTITVSNTSNFPTGVLTVTRSANSFQLNSGNNDSITLDSINTNSTTTFTIRPSTSLGVGMHSAKITVSGYNELAIEINVSVTVIAKSWGINLTPSTINFASYKVGYVNASSVTMEVVNTGNQPTENLNISMNSSNFSLSKINISSLSVGQSATFTITPKTGLAIGNHTVTVTVSSSKTNDSSIGTFVVTDLWDAVWSGSQSFSSSGNFTVPGLVSGGTVQISANASFFQDINDWNGQSSNTIYRSIERKELSTSIVGQLASIYVSNSGSQISFSFYDGDDSFKGYGTFESPTTFTITEVRRRP